MKKILGLDLGTNSIGWSLVDLDFNQKNGNVIGLGSRIIPMNQDVLGNFSAGTPIDTSTAQKTRYRGVRVLYQRNALRRERLHRILNVLNFLPEHYKDAIDFQKRFGQFKANDEVKLNYKKRDDSSGYEFLFADSFHEMIKEFKAFQPQLFKRKKNGEEAKIPYDWTIYYLRKKALSESVTKEELAWIILNFNQKRGYYQLRGEEDEVDKTKMVKYHALKVVDVKISSELKGDEKWYDVILEKGWIYKRKSKVSLDDWIGSEREFIVTTTLNSDGSVKIDNRGNEKRSLRLPKDNDWALLKNKTESLIDKSGKTVGMYIYENLLQNPKQKLHGDLIKTIERSFYKDEFKQILEKQSEFHKDIFQNPELYKDCVNELYPRNEAHQNNLKDKNLIHLIIEDILFYQRPLKTKKYLIANCQYEKRVYRDKETKQFIDSPLKGISKSHPLFQEFRLWQFLKNLRIYEKQQIVNGNTLLDVEVTESLMQNEDDWCALFDFLKKRKEVDQNQLFKYFSDNKLIKKQKKDEFEYRWNYVQDKSYPCCPTYSSFLSRLSKVDSCKPSDFLTDKLVFSLWHLIYSVTDKTEFEQALNSFAKKHDLDENLFVKSFKLYPPFVSDYGSYSEKALRKIVPFMRRGKYWNEESLSIDAKTRIESIINRLEMIDYDINKIDQVKDDDIQNKLLKSFVEFNGKNPLSALNTYQACYAIYNRHSEAKSISKWKKPEDIDAYLNEFRQHSLNNPIVEQVVMETLRVVRDIWRQFGDGATDFFSEIHIELGREMKNNMASRKKLSEKVTNGENTNVRIRKLLTELKNSGINTRPYSSSHQEILKIYEDGVYNGSSKGKFDRLSEKDVEKIRNSKDPSQSEINRYRLWLEQGYVSPYTGKVIPLNKLFTTDYEIEHIIPKKLMFDDSFSNKIICESAVNKLKDFQTAYAFMKSKGTEIVDLGQSKKVALLSIEAYEKHCKNYFSKDAVKLKKLLSEEIPTDFINRQLNDTRYISKLVKGLLSNIVRQEGEEEATSKNIIVVSGQVISELKKHWGMNDIWNRIIEPRFKRLNEITQTNDFGFFDERINAFRSQVPDSLKIGFSKKRIDHRHHALDALVVACCTRDHVAFLTNQDHLRKNIKKEEKIQLRYGLRNKLCFKSKLDSNGNYKWVYFKPWDSFTTDTLDSLLNVVVSFKKNLRVINKATNHYWSFKDENGNIRLDKNGKPKKGLVKQKGTNWTVRKSLHKATFSGKLNLMIDGKPTIVTATRKELSEKFTRQQLDKITDIGIQRILNNHVKKYLNEKGKEQFALAFNQSGINALNENIIELNGGRFHQPIKKVRIY
ncbi:CRISPR-associated protein Csn1, partial [Flavobacteriales bacterium]|nr:CRISPR-associated protein Csn1 [Flavobacteriales bacterium]